MPWSEALVEWLKSFWNLNFHFRYHGKIFIFFFVMLQGTENSNFSFMWKIFARIFSMGKTLLLNNSSVFLFLISANCSTMKNHGEYKLSNFLIKIVKIYYYFNFWQCTRKIWKILLINFSFNCCNINISYLFFFYFLQKWIFLIENHILQFKNHWNTFFFLCCKEFLYIILYFSLFHFVI